MTVSNCVAYDLKSSVLKIFDANPFQLPSNRRLAYSTTALCGLGSGSGAIVATDSSSEV